MKHCPVLVKNSFKNVCPMIVSEFIRKSLVK